MSSEFSVYYFLTSPLGNERGWPVGALEIASTPEILRAILTRWARDDWNFQGELVYSASWFPLEFCPRPVALEPGIYDAFQTVHAGKDLMALLFRRPA